MNGLSHRYGFKIIEKINVINKTEKIIDIFLKSEFFLIIKYKNIEESINIGDISPYILIPEITNALKNEKTIALRNVILLKKIKPKCMEKSNNDRNGKSFGS